MSKAKDITSEVFTRLTVIKRVGTNKFGSATWECLCTCGNSVVVPTNSLRAGYKKSCGCLNTETRKKNAKSMGKANKVCHWEDRFIKFVQLNEKTDCHEWVGDRVIGGYGRFWYNGESWRTHRFIYTKKVGTIPKGLCVLHRCDNPKCVNPVHLFLGTQADNIKDMDSKGRRRKRNSGKRFGIDP